MWTDDAKWLWVSVLVPLVGGTAAFYRWARGSRQDELNRLVDQLQEELKGAKEQLDKYRVDAGLINEARWKLDDLLRELRDSALASRSMVHEMERRAGLPETQFPPLPSPAGLGFVRGPPG